MSKNDMYNDLVEIGIFEKIDAEKTKVFENDIIIESKYVNDRKKYKVDTDNMTNEEIIISLLAKQNLQLKKIGSILIIVLIVLPIIEYILLHLV